MFAACPQTLDKLDDEIHRHQARADSIFQIDEAVMGLISCLCYFPLVCPQWHILILNLSVPYVTLSVHLVCRSSGLRDLFSVNNQMVYGETEMCNVELKCINLFAQ